MRSLYGGRGETLALGKTGASMRGTCGTSILGGGGGAGGGGNSNGDGAGPIVRPAN